MLKKFFNSILALLAIYSILTAQQFKVYSNSADIVIIDEFMGMVSDEDGKVKISSLNSKASWPKEYQNLNIELGDEILFVNGKRIKSQKAFKEEYEKFKTNDIIELGLKRAEERFIVSFKRMDSSKIQRKMITMPAGTDLSDKNISVEDGKIKINGKEVDSDSLEKMGIKVLKTESSKKKKSDHQ